MFIKILSIAFFFIFSAANSINWGRLLPQVVFHVNAYLDLIKLGHVSIGSEVDVCVPSGNFGNILSAYYAKVCKKKHACQAKSGAPC